MNVRSTQESKHPTRKEKELKKPSINHEEALSNADEGESDYYDAKPTTPKSQSSSVQHKSGRYSGLYQLEGSAPRQSAE